MTKYLLSVALFVGFFVVIMPVGLVLRALGIDYLNRKIAPKVDSYWTL